MTKPSKKQRCAICQTHSRFEDVYRFTAILRDMSVAGEYAHPRCISIENAVRAAYRKKFGTDKLPSRNRRLF